MTGKVHLSPWSVFSTVLICRYLEEDRGSARLYDYGRKWRPYCAERRRSVSSSALAWAACGLRPLGDFGVAGLYEDPKRVEYPHRPWECLTSDFPAKQRQKRREHLERARATNRDCILIKALLIEAVVDHSKTIRQLLAGRR
ncbi:hypothetical protein J6590_007082 [Homalodisca vitripennis]|nr:hypothetical protein J6590_007082 [Homalodisca vitripennis]